MFRRPPAQQQARPGWQVAPDIRTQLDGQVPQSAPMAPSMPAAAPREQVVTQPRRAPSTGKAGGPGPNDIAPGPAEAQPHPTAWSAVETDQPSEDTPIVPWMTSGPAAADSETTSPARTGPAGDRAHLGATGHALSLDRLRAITASASEVPVPAVMGSTPPTLWIPDTGHLNRRRRAVDATDGSGSAPPTLRVVPATDPAAADQPSASVPADLPTELAGARPGGRWWGRVRRSVLRPQVIEYQHRTDSELECGLRRRPAPGAARHVTVTSLKGGVGKTTISAALGLTLARDYAARVVGVDLNSDGGTLADRLLCGVPRATVQHLLDDLDDVTSIGDLDRYLELADRLSILAGHQDPSVGAAFAGDDITELMHCLDNFFHTVVADCGTGLADSSMGAVLDQTSTLILVTTPTPDAAELAVATLRWLEGHGYTRLVESSIAVLSGGPAPGDSALRARFQDRCRAVIDIPADPHLAQGGVMTLDACSETTRHAYLALAAAVMDTTPEAGSPKAGAPGALVQHRGAR